MGNRPLYSTDGSGGQSLVDKVHAAIREGILSGAHPPLSRLLVNVIAGQNGVSPIPVREALRRLEAERLVVLEPNRGATVAAISVEDLRDVYETRIVMECHALRLAYPRYSSAGLGEAATELEAMTALLHAGRQREADLRHRAFHFALYAPSGSPWSLHVIRQLWSGAERYLRLSPALRSTPEEFAAEHGAVLAAVRERHVDAAVARLEEHLRRTARLLADAYVARPRELSA